MIFFTTGYSGEKFDRSRASGKSKSAMFRAMVLRNNLVIADIRISPRSHSWMWNQRYLQQEFGDRYIHIPELGNRNYQDPTKPFDLVDEELGMKRLLELGAEAEKAGQAVLIICACEKWECCHRSLVAEKLEEKGVGPHEVAIWDFVFHETGNVWRQVNTGGAN